MRTLNIGRSLYNIHSFVNNEVVSDIHNLGDWGMPVAQIISYLEKENIALENVSSSQLSEFIQKLVRNTSNNSDFEPGSKKLTNF